MPDTFRTPIVRVTSATAKAERAARERDEAMRVAHKAGFSLRAIAAAAGLSHQRVHQIIQTKET